MFERNTLPGPIQHEATILTPCTFKNLKSHIDAIKQGDMWLYRSDEVNRQYQGYISTLKECGSCFSDDIYRLSNESRRPFLLLENPYPYEITDATHYVLFCTDSEPDVNTIKEYFEEWMRERGISQEDVIVFENQYWVRSSTELVHWHVMVRGNMSPE